MLKNSFGRFFLHENIIVAVYTSKQKIVTVSIYLISFNIKQHHYGDDKYSSNIIIENQIFALDSVLIPMLGVNKQKDIMPHPKLLCYITLLLTRMATDDLCCFQFLWFPMGTDLNSFACSAMDHDICLRICLMIPCCVVFNMKILPCSSFPFHHK